MKRIGQFLLANNVYAIAIAFLCAVLEVFHVYVGFVATIILGLVTLQKGPKSGLMMLAWIALPAIALLVLRDWGQSDLLILRCIFMWIFASLLNRYKSWSFLLTLTTAVGVVLIIILHLFVPHLQQWWIKEITAHLNTFYKEVQATPKWNSVKISPAQFAQYAAPYATGVGSFFLIGTLLIELIFARYWQLVVMNLGGIKNELIRIRMNRYAAVVVAILLVLALVFEIPVAADALAFAVLPFFIAGLSLVHFWFRRNVASVCCLVLIYAGLIFMPVIFITVLAIFAFADSWCNFRNRKTVGVEVRSGSSEV